MVLLCLLIRMDWNNVVTIGVSILVALCAVVTNEGISLRGICSVCPEKKFVGPNVVCVRLEEMAQLGEAKIGFSLHSSREIRKTIAGVQG